MLWRDNPVCIVSICSYVSHSSNFSVIMCLVHFIKRFVVHVGIHVPIANIAWTYFYSTSVKWEINNIKAHGVDFVRKRVRGNNVGNIIDLITMRVEKIREISEHLMHAYKRDKNWLRWWKFLPGLEIYLHVRHWFPCLQYLSN